MFHASLADETNRMGRNTTVQATEVDAPVVSALSDVPAADITGSKILTAFRRLRQARVENIAEKNRIAAKQQNFHSMMAAYQSN